MNSSVAGKLPIPERYDCKIGDIIGGRYRVESILGQGSFGYVYKVSDSAGRVWALKLLRLWEVPSTIREPLVERFDMEYRTGRISSRNLVHSADSGFLKGNPYIVMEFCDGGDLTKWIGRPDAPLPRFASEILNGLADLHANGKVHRDLKPENVLLKHDGTAVLTDFGISGDRNKRMTERNIFGKPYQIFGTYAYMPPEQVNRARGGSTVLPTTDIFSFGVLIYQMVTGKLPFGPLEDENDLVRYQRRGKAGEWDRSLLLSSPRGAEWERLIARCLVPDLKDRLQTAREAIGLVPSYGGAAFFPQPAPQDDYGQQASQGYGHQSAVPSYDPQPVAPKITSRHKENARLRIMQGLEHGLSYDLAAILREKGKRLLTAGRDPANDIQIKDYADSYLSRRHFTIEHPSEDVWRLRDGQWVPSEGGWCESTNGTFVGSSAAGREGAELSDGDIITAGDVKFRFETN